MSTLAFQRAGLSIQVSRSSRHFSVSWATSFSRKQHHRASPVTSRSTPISSLPRPEGPLTRSLHTTPVFRQEPRTAASEPSPTSSLTSGFNDEPLILDEGSRQVDWSRSFHGLSSEAFPKEVAEVLLAPIDPEDVEVKPDGIIYLPEIKYRRILNRAFGPGAWGLAPRGETIVTARAVTREYALVAQGRLISVARGEQDYFSPEGIPTATEGCKSNALMRCCKDLGVASELWDPRFIRKFVSERVKEVWVEHQATKKRRKISILKNEPVPLPYKLTTGGS